MNRPAVLILLLIAMIAMSNLFLIDEENQSQAMRCEMFQMYADSRGDYGWPPASNPDAAERCNEEKQ